MHLPLPRRSFMLGGLASGALGGCTTLGNGDMSGGGAVKLPPVRASAERITRITVCTRPFRAQGPRLDVETIGNQRIVHNYGHGGSGWSLSWGSGQVAVAAALATGVSEIAVIGCGALGLTSAIVAQRAGLKVSIYAKERPPEVRSSLASGIWSPDSRICAADEATPSFKTRWASMCRNSFARYQDYVGLAGDPVEWIDFYRVEGGPMRPAAQRGKSGPAPRFAQLQRELTPELPHDFERLSGSGNPFPGLKASRVSLMMFNIGAYAHLLMQEFLEAGGKIETLEFHSPADFARLPQATLINCTGYGARALFRDESVVPVRGQLVRLIPQADVRYGVSYDDVMMLPRRDGMVVQVVGPDETVGFGDDDTTPDPEEAKAAVETIGSLFGRPPLA